MPVVGWAVLGARVSASMRPGCSGVPRPASRRMQKLRRQPRSVACCCSATWMSGFQMSEP